MDMIENLERHESEYIDALEKIWKQCQHISECKYFLDTEFAWAKYKTRPRVVVLGTDIPEELVYAASAEPYWLIGGSLSSTAWSDELVPRDTDPVSRSILGYIHQPGSDFSDALFVIPLVSDSMRKIAYQLKAEGRQICLLDIPPDPENPKAEELCQKQMLAMTHAIAAHTKTRITKNTVLSAIRRVSNARRALTAFLQISRDRPDVVPAAARLLVQDSYYRTSHLDEWTFRLQGLTEQIRLQCGKGSCHAQNRPRIAVMGSPIVFPNYKIPFLVQDAGLHLTDVIDSTALKQHLLYGNGSLTGSSDRIIRNVASTWYQRAASHTFVRNDELYRFVSWRMQKGDIEGVVYHVLKGQIAHDFELERFEALFAEYGIPVFRLETDYQYQDIEQLRIRLEAFSEMLTQNRCKGVKGR
jgi:Benzoyl-CoA reductase/2-hydroxyglutaryl-CoA dehydratase subunit, BcrC/BadD/HgdB